MIIIIKTLLFKFFFFVFFFQCQKATTVHKVHLYTKQCTIVNSSLSSVRAFFKAPGLDDRSTTAFTEYVQAVAFNICAS